MRIVPALTVAFFLSGCPSPHDSKHETGPAPDTDTDADADTDADTDADADADADADTDSDTDTDTGQGPCPGIPIEVSELDPYVQPTIRATPANPVAGGSLVVRYDGSLRKASSLVIHYGFNGWNEVQGVKGLTTEASGSDMVTWGEQSMSAVDGGWETELLLPTDGRAVHYVFYDPDSGTWDNNGGLDYHQSIVFPYIGPFLTWNDLVGPSSGMVITWETSVPGKGVVEYGLSEDLGAFAVGDSTDTIHHVALSNLNEGTRYHYRVHDAACNVSPIYTFTTAAADTSTFKFVVAGDTQDNGEDSRWSDVIDELLASHADAAFVLHVGDMAADDSPGHWWTFFDRARDFFANRALMSVPGNHDDPDVGISTDWTHFLRYFDLPGTGTAYSFRYGQALFLGLNSEDAAGFSAGVGDQYVLAQSALSGCGSGNARSCAPVFGYWHMPAYNVGARHYQEQGTYRDVTGLFDQLVDLHFAGHEHLYQRIVPMQYNAVLAPSGEYGMDADDGVCYVVLPPAGNWTEDDIISTTDKYARYRDRLAFPVLVGDETVVESEIGFATVDVDGTNWDLQVWGMGTWDKPAPTHVQDSTSGPR